ncbi:MAG: 2-C-methyl-D-erythritol 4-phosphate cytidylyltransferase [Lachnospiraceae bacterium]
MAKEKVVAIVLAAGKGRRMQTETPKQFMDLCGKPVLYYSLDAFEHSKVDEIVIVTGKEDVAYVETEIVNGYHLNKVVKIVPGGAQRYESVYQGLLASMDADIVLIHDGARPLIQPNQINDTIAVVQQYGACVIAVPSKDTVKIADEDGFVAETPKRASVWNVQTPQAFYYRDLKRAYEKMLNDGDSMVTDDAMVMECYGAHRVKLVEGTYTNLKITTKEDMEIAAKFIQDHLV